MFKKKRERGLSTQERAAAKASEAAAQARSRAGAAFAAVLDDLALEVRLHEEAQQFRQQHRSVLLDKIAALDEQIAEIGTNLRYAQEDHEALSSVVIDYND